jgi:hypothetical protein
MSPKKFPLFKVALGLVALVAVGEGWCIYERYDAARLAEKKLSNARGQLQVVADTVPAPSRETAVQIEADLAKAQQSLATMQLELRGRGPTGTRLAALKPPVARTDAFFDLATYVARSRAFAEKQGVTVAPAATHFGFSIYANEGPEPVLINAVFRQRLVAHYLIEALLTARPRALLSLQRERPLTAEERKTRTEAQAAAAADPTTAASAAQPEKSATLSPDYFDLDPRLPAQASGFVEMSAFRLAFTGQTATLRAFLNQLASFELPVIVRAVEVEPASGEDLVGVLEEAPPVVMALPATAPASIVLTAPPAKIAPPSKAPAIAPIVAKSLSKFTVTVEFVELIPPAPAVASSP